jgi:putative membrane protein
MFAWTSHGTELKRFARQPITRAAIAVMLLIPLLYGAMYVWAFWDPTIHMSKLPVALVNADTGATRDGAPVHYGQDVVDNLVDDGSLGWAKVDAATAKAGLEKGKYYFAVTIPADFSSSIVSLGGESPKAAQIDVTYDDTNSFLASTLGRSAMMQVQESVRSKVGQEAVDTLLIGVGKARDGFGTASDGAFSLRDGLTTARDGSEKLNVGAQDLAAGAAKLAAGTGQLSTGAAALRDGLTTYVAGVTKAADGAQQLSDGAAKLTELQNGLVQLADASAAPAVAAGVATMTDGLTTYGSGATSYSAGATDFVTGAGAWIDGATSWRQQAYAGTSQLSQGSTAVSSGATSLAANTGGGSALAVGAGQVATGTTQLVSGLGTVDGALAEAQQELTSGDTATALAILGQARAGLQSAQTSASALATGAGQVSAGIASVGTTAQTLATGASQVSSGVTSVQSSLSDSGPLAAGITKLSSGQQQLAGAATKLTAGSTQLADPKAMAQAQQLKAGAQAVSDGISALNTGAASIPALQEGAKTLAAGFSATSPTEGLVSGAGALQDGATTLATAVAAADTGAQQLEAGASTIAESTPDLASGLATATDGASTLGTKLSDGASAIPNDSTSVQTARADAVSAPVTVQSEHVYQADSWGEGFAPFFIPLALWVGALITWLLLRPLQSRALMTSVNGFRMAWGSLNSALLLSVGQVAIMLSVMHFAIGLNPKNIVATIAMALLTAAAFFALQQLLQVSFGSAVGKVVIIVLLMVQLASAGGTYPIQTTPAFLQAISPYMPMTYVVNGLREAITGGVEARYWMSVAVLTAIFVVSLAATSIVSARKRMWTMGRLHPALDI